MLTERILCRCLGVTREEVICTISVLNLMTLKEVRDFTAGGGCTCCHRELRMCLEQHAAAAATSLESSLAP
jgi:bacterioferritin-associated ferredoxin